LAAAKIIPKRLVSRDLKIFLDIRFSPVYFFSLHLVLIK
jgi:hypothetical protein